MAAPVDCDVSVDLSWWHNEMSTLEREFATRFFAYHGAVVSGITPASTHAAERLIFMRPEMWARAPTRRHEGHGHAANAPPASAAQSHGPTHAPQAPGRSGLDQAIGTGDAAAQQTAVTGGSSSAALATGAASVSCHADGCHARVARAASDISGLFDGACAERNTDTGTRQPNAAQFDNGTLIKFDFACKNGIVSCTSNTDITCLVCVCDDPASGGYHVCVKPMSVRAEVFAKKAAWFVEQAQLQFVVVSRSGGAWKEVASYLFARPILHEWVRTETVGSSVQHPGNPNKTVFGARVGLGGSQASVSHERGPQAAQSLLPANSPVAVCALGAEAGSNGTPYKQGHLRVRRDRDASFLQGFQSMQGVIDTMQMQQREEGQAAVFEFEQYAKGGQLAFRSTAVPAGAQCGLVVLVSVLAWERKTKRRAEVDMAAEVMRAWDFVELAVA